MAKSDYQTQIARIASKVKQVCARYAVLWYFVFRTFLDVFEVVELNWIEQMRGLLGQKGYSCVPRD